MRYFVSLDSHEVPVDVILLPGGGYDVRVDGEQVDADLVALPDGLSIRVGQRMIDLAIEGALPNLEVATRGHRGGVKVESDRGRAAAAVQRPAQVDQRAIVSPMPGRIVKVLVAPQDAVEANQPVVVVEAMKMENELRAPRGGQVTRIAVKPGDRVEAGAILVEID